MEFLLDFALGGGGGWEGKCMKVIVSKTDIFVTSETKLAGLGEDFEGV
jgi:hypothetical protein